MPDLQIVKRLPQDQEPVGVAQAINHVGPRVVRERRTHDRLHVWVDLPDPLQRFDAIPTRWHPNIHKRQRKGLPLFNGPLDDLQGFLALHRRCQLEGQTLTLWLGCSQQRGLGIGGACAAGAADENVAVGAMDRFAVVDKQDAGVHGSAFSLPVLIQPRRSKSYVREEYRAPHFLLRTNATVRQCEACSVQLDQTIQPDTLRRGTIGRIIKVSQSSTASLVVVMTSIRFVMLGGFLGAGKTTTIARLAQAYQQRGLRVGIVTNDQAADLVDTHALRSQGFEVGEVAGACFCCNFNELTDVAAKLGEDERPDVILAEPVGSCTDLVATVVQPLVQLHADRFEVAPYGVILKPSHGRRILKNEPNAGFSPKAAYIFRKQLEEADFIVLNRIDQLSKREVDELQQLLKESHPDVPTLRMSARTGVGFGGLLELLEQRGDFGRRVLELDYDTYAEGEAELGWLNANLAVSAEKPFSLDDLLIGIVNRLRTSLIEQKAEAAHLKAIGLWEGAHGVANLISNDVPAELSLPAECQTKNADLVVNARVAVDPQVLDKEVRRAVEAACSDLAASADWRQVQSFRPGRPVPTHRLAAQ